jgi:hypothetical protein
VAENGGEGVLTAYRRLQRCLDDPPELLAPERLSQIEATRFTKALAHRLKIVEMP